MMMNIKTYGTFDQAKILLKEVMKNYYYKNPYLQYSYAKMYSYGSNRYYSPEEITSQDIQYATCSGWVYNVYFQTFGMKTSGTTASYNDSMPAYADSMMSSAEKYYNDYHNNPSKLNDGTFLLYYENSSENIKYVYDNGVTDDVLDDNATFKEFVKLLQPGDILLYGHAVIVYDVIDRDNDGEIDDALLLNINGKAHVRNNFSDENYLYYEFFAHREGDREENYHYENNDYLNVEHEGALKWRYMNAVPTKTTFMHGNNYKYLSCNKKQCAIIRPFYNNNGSAIFNYDILPSYYHKSELRSRYPSIKIEKTVDVGDNNSVNREDILTYTISIDDIENENNIWKRFKIVENIDTNLVELVDGSCNCQYSSTCSVKCDGKQISWTVGNPRFSLGTSTSNVNRKNAKLTYQVKVKNNATIHDTITSTGNFYGYVNNSDDTVVDDTVSITTGTVENKIVSKASKTQKNYSSCWNENKDNGHNGLSLIEDIYSCTRGEGYINFFNDFDFNTIFYKEPLATRATANAMYFKDNDVALKYKSMNLNNYWNGTIKKTSSTILPRFADINSFRAKTIKSSDFKEGDILIYSIVSSNYTNESGLYAFIYIDNKFVGVNGIGDTKRNEFTSSYYGNDEDNIVNNLYGAYKRLSNVEEGYTAEEISDFLEFANYQTLFDKDYYIILRPEIVIKELIDIEIIQNPTKLNYLKGEDIDLNGMIVNRIYNNGEIEEINNNDLVLSGYNKNQLGSQEITVTYGNKTAKFNVIVKNDEIFEYLDSEVKKSNSMLYNINYKKNKYNTLFIINEVYSYDIYDKNDNIKTNNIVATGDKLKIYYNNNLITQYKLSVVADANGDGNITPLDYIRIKNYIMGDYNIVEEEYLDAADANRDGNITPLDYIRIKNLIMNGEV